MQLSQKQKPFSELFCEFFKSPFNFGHFQKKDDSHSSDIPTLRTPKNMVRSISKRSRF